MDDEGWNAFRRQQEREALMSTIDDALAQVPRDLADRLRADFPTCLEEGGMDSVYSIAECIDWIRIPLLYPVLCQKLAHGHAALR